MLLVQRLDHWNKRGHPFESGVPSSCDGCLHVLWKGEIHIRPSNFLEILKRYLWNEQFSAKVTQFYSIAQGNCWKSCGLKLFFFGRSEISENVPEAKVNFCALLERPIILPFHFYCPLVILMSNNIPSNSACIWTQLQAGNGCVKSRLISNH